MAQAAGSVWTDDRLEQLKSLWSKGLSITQIGQEIGVSRNAVVGKVHRMGLPKRQSPIVVWTVDLVLSCLVQYDGVGCVCITCRPCWRLPSV